MIGLLWLLWDDWLLFRFAQKQFAFVAIEHWSGTRIIRWREVLCWLLELFILSKPITLGDDIGRLVFLAFEEFVFLEAERGFVYRAGLLLLVFIYFPDCVVDIILALIDI